VKPRLSWFVAAPPARGLRSLERWLASVVAIEIAPERYAHEGKLAAELTASRACRKMQIQAHALDKAQGSILPL
jgi:hypothetical protein